MPFTTRLTPDMIARHTRRGWWGKDTIYGLLAAQVAAHPQREAIVDPRRRITYAELKDGIDRTAAVLKAHGGARERAVANAIRITADNLEHQVNQQIERDIARAKEAIAPALTTPAETPVSA